MNRTTPITTSGIEVRHAHLRLKLSQQPDRNLPDAGRSECPSMGEIPAGMQAMPRGTSARSTSQCDCPVRRSTTLIRSPSLTPTRAASTGFNAT